MTGIRIAAPDTASPGEVIEIRTLIQHPMESGFRRDARGVAIARDIITRFECRYLGDLVFAADFFPAIAANPFLTFHVRARESGTLTFSWTSQDGEIWSDSHELTVA